MVTCSVRREDPFKPVVQKSLHRTTLFAPRMPVVASRSAQATLLRIPPDVVPREEELVAVKQRLAARRVSRSRNDKKVVGQPDRILPLDRPLDAEMRIGGMHDPIAPEVIPISLMIRNVVDVRQEHPLHAAQLLQSPDQGGREAGRIDQHISTGAQDQVAGTAERILEAKPQKQTSS